MKVLRLILFPFTPIFGLVAFLRNLLFDIGIFRSKRFDLPVISVGNLTVGGAGKSPMTEYLINLLTERFKLATLSRGYGRKSKGFRMVGTASHADEVGDEPLQFKNKFPRVTVAVAEERVKGIKKLQEDHDLIILDDAYQHRWVKPGFSILLYEYESIFKVQWFLPTGDLREPLIGRKRAHCIVVTKCPVNLTEGQKRAATEKIRPYSHQQVFFSFLEYGNLMRVNASDSRDLASLNSMTEIVLLTGIANPAPLVEKLREHTARIEHFSYPDHYTFTPKNIAKIAETYAASDSEDKLVITTEKDLQRLKAPELYEHLQHLPVYYLPVKAAFEQDSKGRFDDLILSYVTKHRKHN